MNANPRPDFNQKTQSKEARVDFRCNPEEKEMIEEAAMVSGTTVTNFIRSNIIPIALETIREHQITRLSAADEERFVALIESEDPPSPALVSAAERYRKIREDSK